MRITKEQYEEYEALKEWAKRENILKSAKDIKNLEDDIDVPIKRCVAFLALLGCNPVYSCCGFDYEGQPLHKSHQYGRPYIKLVSGDNTTQIVYSMQSRKKFLWQVKNNSIFTDIEVFANSNPYWRQHECIHFAEECNLAILQMENFLLSFKNYMVASITLTDTNAQAKSKIKHWVYPPKEPWTIKKDDFI